jgi:RimJ/RimL family protein N-acetyltransferase
VLPVLRVLTRRHTGWVTQPEPPAAPPSDGPPLPWHPALPIATERLLLRPLRAGDEADVLAYRGQGGVSRFMPQYPLTADAATDFVALRIDATKIAADGDRILLALDLDQRVIGDVMLRVRRLEHLQGEVGWVVHPDFGGQGFATEAARALLRVGFAEFGLHRICAELDPRNAPSARMCERLGMRHEALFREDFWFKGEWGDSSIYAILRSEWERQPGAGASGRLAR